MYNLQQLRMREGLTQEKVARNLGLNRSTIGKWEAGDSFPRAAMIPQIAILYKCTVEDILNLISDQPTRKENDHAER